MNREGFTSSFPVQRPFPCRSCLVALARTSSTMWSKNGNRGVLVLFPNSLTLSAVPPDSWFRQEIKVCASDTKETGRKRRWAWLVWLSGLSMGQRTKGSPIRFPVRTHAWVVGQVPSRGCARGNHTLMFPSLSPSLPLSEEKEIKSLKKEKKRKKEEAGSQSIFQPWELMVVYCAHTQLP